MTDMEKVIWELERIRDYDPMIRVSHDDVFKGYAEDALLLLNALWKDLNKARPCFACKNQSKCDPNDSGEKQRFWVSCGGSCKLKWEWRGFGG